MKSVRSEDVSHGEPEYRIDFSSDRLPYFIINSHGLSHCESWGRWTLGPVTRLKFRQELPKKFRIQIRGHAFKSNHGLAMTVKVGSAIKTVTMSSSSGFITLSLDMCCDNPGSTLEISNPNPRSPFEISSGKDPDKRPLGIALSHIMIFEKV
jgi:hypothetical protein